MDSRVRIGRWKETVSSVQRARKKKYCSRIGWVASHVCPRASAVWRESVALKTDAVPLVRLSMLDEKEGDGGGGIGGSAGEDGVAFSIRAQVR